ncbi:MAG: phage tail protein [Myxococcota bacterium]
MRRRRLIGGPAPGGPQWPATRDDGVIQSLKDVLSCRFPLRAAKTFLGRHLGQLTRVHFREVERGEQPGRVVAIEVRHARGGAKSWIRGERQMASGAPASFYVPDHLVTVRTHVEGPLAKTGVLGMDDLIVLHVPVRGYTRYLPAIFHGEGPVRATERKALPQNALVKAGGAPVTYETSVQAVDGDPLSRFLFLFQTMMATVTSRVDRLVTLTDPLQCDPEFLPWLASWVGFELDGALPVQQQRELVRRAIRLFRTRGTRGGIEEMVRVLTTAPAAIEERTPPAPMVLGQGRLISGRTLAERYQRGEPRGSYLYDATPETRRRFFTLRLEPRSRFARRFGERATHALARIVDIVSRERPAHLAFTIDFDVQD